MSNAEYYRCVRELGYGKIHSFFLTLKMLWQVYS